MWNDDWPKEKHTLPYILEKTDRFNGINGEYQILFEDSKIIACGGVYRSEFNNYVAIGGVRTWTDEKYRHLSILRESLLPSCKRWAIQNQMKLMMLSFNDYNKNLIQVFKRRRLGEMYDRISTRQPHHLFYNGLLEIDFPIIIQHTKQWGIYEKFYDWDFDWVSIKAE
jgi:hypothetical protein